MVGVGRRGAEPHLETAAAHERAGLIHRRAAERYAGDGRPEVAELLLSLAELERVTAKLERHRAGIYAARATDTE